MRSSRKREVCLACACAVVLSCEPAPEEPPARSHETSGLSPVECIKTGRFVEAERRLRPTLEESARPATPAARARTHHLLALALSGQGRFDAALAEIEAAARDADQNPEVHRAFGNILLKQGRAAEAVHRYRRALELAGAFRQRTGLEVPDLHRWRYELAQALTRLGRDEEARVELAHYERQQTSEIELRNLERRAGDQRSPAAHHEYAEALQRAGRVKEAVRALRAALAVDPDFVAAHVELSVLLARNAAASPPYARPALLELATRHARQALEVRESAAAWLALARAERMRGNVEAAEESMEKALTLSRGDPVLGETIEETIEELRELTPGRRSP